VYRLKRPWGATFALTDNGDSIFLDGEGMNTFGVVITGGRGPEVTTANIVFWPKMDDPWKSTMGAPKGPNMSDLVWNRMPKGKSESSQERRSLLRCSERSCSSCRQVEMTESSRPFRFRKNSYLQKTTDLADDCTKYAGHVLLLLRWFEQDVVYLLIWHVGRAILSSLIPASVTFDRNRLSDCKFSSVANSFIPASVT